MISANTKEILASYPQLPFEKAISIDLNERFDQKFVLPIERSELLIESLKNNFLVQSIHGDVLQVYQTRYWDTDNFDLFQQHAMGRIRRYKVRKRYYVSTNTCFLELKMKEKSKTLKFRMISDYNGHFPENEMNFLKKKGVDTSHMRPVLDIMYKRLILWSNELDGRITIDFEYSLGSDKQSKFQHVAIVEMKGSRQFINSCVRKMPFPISRFQSPFSKYFVGMIECHQFSKQSGKKLFFTYQNLFHLNKTKLC